MAPILGYWDARGFANPSRMLLAYAGVRYEDKRYSRQSAEVMNEWFKKDKPALLDKFDFPNLPYYIDGNVHITQSKAILSYIGRKHGLNGNTEEELLRMSLIMEQFEDMRSALARMAYPPTCAKDRAEIHESLRKEYVGDLDKKLKGISSFLGENEWMSGGKLTYVDFYVYDILDFHRLLFNPKHFNAFPNLVKYMERFEGLKGVKEHLNNPEKFQRMPIYSQYAMFGGTADYKPSD